MPPSPRRGKEIDTKKPAGYYSLAGLCQIWFGAPQATSPRPFFGSDRHPARLMQVAAALSPCCRAHAFRGAVYNPPARVDAVTRVADGASLEQAAPACRHPDRIACASTIARWRRRRIESLRFWLSPTLFAWGLESRRAHANRGGCAGMNEDANDSAAATVATRSPDFALWIATAALLFDVNRRKQLF